MTQEQKQVSLQFERSTCPVAVWLDILGDKWTLLIVRDIFLGARRYSDFEQSPEAYPTNILADRLKRLVEHEIVEKTAYSERPRRFEYRLTIRGKKLKPVLKCVMKWGNEFYPGTTTTPGAAVSTRRK